MRKFIGVIVAGSLCFALSACAQEKVIDGVKYKPYGLLTEEQDKNPNIKYEVVWGNVFLGAMFSETLVIPGYFLCFSIFEPTGKVGGVKGAA